MISWPVGLNSAVTTMVLVLLAACGGTSPASNLTPVPTQAPTATLQPTAVAPPTLAEDLIASPTPTPTPTRAPTVASPVSTPVPTRTSVPTYAPTLAPTSAPVPTSAPTPRQSPVPTPTPRSQGTPTANEAATDSGFSPGIYYGSPISRSYEKFLTKVEGPLSRRISYESAGFDIRPEAFVFVGRDTVTLIDSDGGQRQISVQGIEQMARPSFSPDGKRVAVQARDTLLGPEDLNIYIVDLETGEVERISFLNVNEESPEWFPNDNRIAYSSFSPEEGLNIHIYDADAAQELRSFRDGAIHEVPSKSV